MKTNPTPIGDYLAIMAYASRHLFPAASAMKSYVGELRGDVGEPLRADQANMMDYLAQGIIDVANEVDDALDLLRKRYKQDKEAQVGTGRAAS